MSDKTGKPGPYDDIIHLPHHVSPTRPRMSAAARAAQFSPFAALTGFEGAIRETARLTDQRILLDENECAALDTVLAEVSHRLPQKPQVTLTHFVPDQAKTGGAYVQITDRVSKLDALEHTLTLASGQVIALADILEIQCDE